MADKELHPSRTADEIESLRRHINRRLDLQLASAYWISAIPFIVLLLLISWVMAAVKTPNFVGLDKHTQSASQKQGVTLGEWKKNAIRSALRKGEH